MVIHSRQSQTERYIRKKCAIRAPEAILFRPRNYKRSGEVKKTSPGVLVFLVHLLFSLLLFVCSLFLMHVHVEPFPCRWRGGYWVDRGSCSCHVQTCND